MGHFAKKYQVRGSCNFTSMFGQIARVVEKASSIVYNYRAVLLVLSRVAIKQNKSCAPPTFAVTSDWS